MRGASESDPWYSEVPVSDEKDPKPIKGDAAEPEASPEDVDDVDELEGAGFDRVVSQARDRAAGIPLAPLDPDELDPGRGERPYTAEEVGLRTKASWGRSPIVSLAVLVVGLFLLVATWSDFRYFLRSLQSAPRELGTVSDIYKDGEFSERFDNQWIVLEGDPDVQHAARMQGRDGWIGFMRLVEGDASLFVAIPRATEKATNEFPGRFEGRMRRISEVPQWEKLQTFFNAEEITEARDLDPAAVIAAAGSSAGELGLAPTDSVRVIVRQSTAMVQLGRTTWPTRAAADEIMQVFGKPSIFVEKRDMVWVYALEVGVDAKLELFQDLTEALNGGDGLASADPKVGGLVLPRRTTYMAQVGDLAQAERDGAPALSFTYAGNTAETGWRVQGDALVPIELERGRLAVPVAAIEAIRVERSLVADPRGYLIMVDQRPRDVWPSALMFGVVLGVVLLNGWGLVATLRRRQAAVQQGA